MLLYELLTCNLPYEGANARALLQAKTSDEPRPPSYHVPGFDPHLEAIILKAIERDPRHRYPDAAALLADLKDPAAVPTRDPETGARREAARRRARRRLAVGVILAVLAVGLAALVWSSSRYRPPEPAPAGGALGERR
jgi:serine/threonine-protein kinase